MVSPQGDTTGDAKKPSKTQVDTPTKAEVADAEALEAFLTNRELLKAINKGTSDALAKLNEKHGKQRPNS